MRAREGRTLCLGDPLVAVCSSLIDHSAGAPPVTRGAGLEVARAALTLQGRWNEGAHTPQTCEHAMNRSQERLSGID